MPPVALPPLLLRWHRRLGLAAAPFVLVLVVTGVVLDRADELGLADARVNADWLEAWYGIAPPDPPLAYRLDDRWLIGYDGALFLDGEAIAVGAGAPVGAALAGRTIVVATATARYLFTTDGALIEKLSGPLLPGPLDAAASEPLQWARPATPPEALLSRVTEARRGPGLSWERVLLDLHSGRLLGRAGPYLMDAAAVVLGLLALSGVYNALRPRGR